MAFQQPHFTSQKYFPPFGVMNKEFPYLNVPFEGHMAINPMIFNLIQLIDEIRQGGKMPQIFVLCMDRGNTPEINSLFAQALLEAGDGCYEFLDHFQMIIENLSVTHNKFILRIRPFKRCLDRMIRKNYYLENDSIMSSMDFDLAFQGVQNNMTKRVEQIKSENPQIFYKE